MDLRSILSREEQKGRLRVIEQAVSSRFEAARIIRRNDPEPVMFKDVDGWRVAANIVTGRKVLAEWFALDEADFLASFNALLDDEGRFPVMKTGSSLRRALSPPDLETLPILHHFECDGGRYITSGVWVIKDPEWGRNLSYHRMMVLDSRSGSVRVVERRGMDMALKRGGPGATAAICIGAPLNVLVAAAMSPPPEVDELEIAAKLGPLELVKCETVELEVPAATELVIEGRFTGGHAREGPFIDITGTLDIVRSQPVFEITAATCLEKPVYHALLPSGSEHRTLMGLPKELDIYSAVRRCCYCRDVVITTGGCSWLHAVIAIKKERDADPLKVIDAAFEAHRSLKHCVVVDDDIDPRDPGQVEWAIATRFQAHRDLVTLPDRPSSSLDPSAFHTPGNKSRGSKMGLDATIKAGGSEELKLFKRVDLES